jgi:hypothetical protein
MGVNNGLCPEKPVNLSLDRLKQEQNSEIVECCLA